MDTRLALMTGSDIPIPECQMTLHQPSLKEIGLIGESDFFTGTQCLSIYKSMFVTEDKTALDDVNNFQIFMTVMKDKESFDKKNSVLQVLTLLFPKYNKVLFTPQSLIFQAADSQDNRIIDEKNFDALQEVIRDITCSKSGPMDQQAFNPANDKAREIAEKLMRGRQRVAAQNGSANVSIFSLYLSVLTIGLHIPLEDLINCTMFQLYDLMERYSLYTNWDLDVRTRLAGGKPDSQPENWMKNIHQY